MRSFLITTSSCWQYMSAVIGNQDSKGYQIDIVSFLWLYVSFRTMPHGSSCAPLRWPSPVAIVLQCESHFGAGMGHCCNCHQKRTSVSKFLYLNFLNCATVIYLSIAFFYRIHFVEASRSGIFIDTKGRCLYSCVLKWVDFYHSCQPFVIHLRRGPLTRLTFEFGIFFSVSLPVELAPSSSLYGKLL